MYKIISYGSLCILVIILAAIAVLLPKYLFPYSFTANEISIWTIYGLLSVLLPLFVTQILFIISFFINSKVELSEEEIHLKRIQGGKLLLYGLFSMVITSIFINSSGEGGDLGTAVAEVIMGLILVFFTMIFFIRALTVLLKTFSAGVLIILFLLVGIIQVRLVIEINEELAWRSHAEKARSYINQES